MVMIDITGRIQFFFVESFDYFDYVREDEIDVFEFSFNQRKKRSKVLLTLFDRSVLCLVFLVPTRQIDRSI